jgi:hypothetical protein
MARLNCSGGLSWNGESTVDVDCTVDVKAPWKGMALAVP